MRQAVATLIDKRREQSAVRRRLAALAELHYKAIRKLPVLNRKAAPPGYVCTRWTDGEPWRRT